MWVGASIRRRRHRRPPRGHRLQLRQHLRPPRPPAADPGPHAQRRRSWRRSPDAPGRHQLDRRRPSDRRRVRRSTSGSATPPRPSAAGTATSSTTASTRSVDGRRASPGTPSAPGGSVAVEEAEIELVAPFELDGRPVPAGRAGQHRTLRASTQPEPGHLRVARRRRDRAAARASRSRADAGRRPRRGPDLPLPRPSRRPTRAPGIAEPAAVAALAALGGGLADVAAGATRRPGARRHRRRAGAADVAFGAIGSVGAARRRRPSSPTSPPPSSRRPRGSPRRWAGSSSRSRCRPDHKVAWLIEAAHRGGRRPPGGGRQDRPHRPHRAGRRRHAGRPRHGLRRPRRRSSSASTTRPSRRAGPSSATMLEELVEGERPVGPGRRPAQDVRRAAARRAASASLAMVAGAVGGGAGRPLRRGLARPRGASGALGAGIGLGRRCSAAGSCGCGRPPGSGLWLRVESFRRFLHESEAYHAEEAAKRGVLREYTAWAVAVGELDRWKHAVQASTVIPESAGLNYVFLAPMLASSTSRASTAPSSSGGGGGGGGGRRRWRRRRRRQLVSAQLPNMASHCSSVFGREDVVPAPRVGHRLPTAPAE